MPRSYQLKRRAETQDETRSRIVEATIALHQERGPAFTSFSDIAARAGVGRMTVYRHFPDEATLLAACSGSYFEHHPLPDVGGAHPADDPAERFRAAITAAYAYHRRTEAMMTPVLAQVGDQPVVRPYHDHWRNAADQLAEAFDVKDPRCRTTIRAAILLALSFSTWRLLVREGGLTNHEAIDLGVHYLLSLM